MVDFLEFNENESTEYPSLWNTMKIVLGEKFIALSAFIYKLETLYTSNLRTHPKVLEQKEKQTYKTGIGNGRK